MGFVQSPFMDRRTLGLPHRAHDAASEKCSGKKRRQRCAHKSGMSVRDEDQADDHAKWCNMYITVNTCRQVLCSGGSATAIDREETGHEAADESG